MSTRDKIGAVVLAALFAAFAAILVWRARPQGVSRSMKDSVVIQQRMKNLNQGK